MSKQPEALRLANRLENGGEPDLPLLRAFAAAELRRQHALIAELVEALEQMRRWMPVYPAAADGINGGREAHAAAMKAAAVVLSNAKGQS